MNPIRFVLAVPLAASAGGSPLHFEPLGCAPCLEGLCAERPHLWVDGDGTAIDLGAAGTILGILFAKGSGARLRALPARAPVHRGAETLAAWLSRECWGAYLAILADPEAGRFCVFPDPSGLLPVYRTQSGSHILFSPDPSLFREAGIASPGVGWKALHSFLGRPELRQQTSCLEGVSELTPGALAAVREGCPPALPIWRPDDFMPVGAIATFDELAEALRNLAVTTIGAWATLWGRVAVAASGGVDSSFICAALARGGHDFDCITLATADPSGDESVFVRQLAEHLSVRAIAATYDLAQVDLFRPASLGLTRPSRKAFMSALDLALREAGDELGADTVFDGNGGDNLFCYLHSAAPVVDRLRAEGPGPAALETFLDVCRLTGCDIPAMARAALRRLMRPPGIALWPLDGRLLADLLDAPLQPLTPWLEIGLGRFSGKRDHLALIMRAQNHVHGLPARSPQRFSVLMSQPLVEFCLAVPTWLWCKGGINRSLARAAFASDLPSSIVARTSKSGPDSFIRRMFAANQPLIREMLLDGLLMRHGVLDRTATEKALSIDALSGDSMVYRLLDLAEAESWARSWSG
jgi:asparagine synthase (glutamine-hydrolysing)